MRFVNKLLTPSWVPTLLTPSILRACQLPVLRFVAANYQDVQQVQQRIAATLQSVMATAALPAVLAGTIAFPGCVHIMCTFASQLPDI
jgi:hypothetical protein